LQAASPPTIKEDLAFFVFFWHGVLRIGGASALVFTGVLAFAAVVARLAATLALARVLALTGMLFFLALAGALAGLGGVFAGVLCDHSLTSNESCQGCAHH